MFDFINVPNNTPSDVNRIVQYLKKRISIELSNLTTPCYYLKISKFWKDIVYITGIDDEIIKEYIKRVPSDFLPRKILMESSTILCIYGIIYFMKEKQYEISKLFYYLLSLKFQGSVMHKQFRIFCNPDIWGVAYDKISSKHNYQIKGGVSNALIYVSDVEFDKTLTKFKKLKKQNNTSELDEWNLINVFVHDLRNKINQSFVSFSRKYYEIQKDETIVIKKIGDDDKGDDELPQISISDQISISISTHGQIDKKSMNKAISYSGIKAETGIYMIKKLSDVSTREKLNFLIILLGKIIEYKQICNDRKRNFLIRKVMSNYKIQKYEIKNMIWELLESIDEDYIIRITDKDQCISFFLNYVTLYIQSRICS